MVVVTLYDVNFKVEIGSNDSCVKVAAVSASVCARNKEGVIELIQKYYGSSTIIVQSLQRSVKCEQAAFPIDIISSEVIYDGYYKDSPLNNIPAPATQ